MSVGLESGQCALVPLSGAAAVPPLRSQPHNTAPSIGTAVDHCSCRNVITSTPIWTQLLCSNDHVLGCNQCDHYKHRTVSLPHVLPRSVRRPLALISVARDPGHCSWCWRWLLMLFHIPFLTQICHWNKCSVVSVENSAERFFRAFRAKNQKVLPPIGMIIIGWVEGETAPRPVGAPKPPFEHSLLSTLWTGMPGSVIQIAVSVHSWFCC